MIFLSAGAQINTAVRISGVSVAGGNGKQAPNLICVR